MTIQILTSVEDPLELSIGLGTSIMNLTHSYEEARAFVLLSLEYGYKVS